MLSTVVIQFSKRPLLKMSYNIFDYGGGKFRTPSDLFIIFIALVCTVTNLFTIFRKRDSCRVCERFNNGRVDDKIIQNKNFITMEVFSSMTKYEDVYVFINKNRDETIRKYKEIIKNEVFKNFEQEKGYQPTEDEKEFIKASVESIINYKIKKFIHQQKMGKNYQL